MTNLARLRSELALIVLDDSLEPYFKDWINDAVLDLASDFDLPGLRLLSPINLVCTTANWLYNPPDSMGEIATIAITNGGTGYSEGDILTIVEAGAVGAEVVVTEVAAGVVTAVKLTDGGNNYTTGAGKPTLGGGNDDCTIEVAALSSTQVAFHKNLFQARDSEWNDIYVCKRWEELDALDIDHDETGDHISHIGVTQDDSMLGIYPKANETIRLWFYKKPTPLAEEGDEPTCIPEEYRLRTIIPKVVIKNFKYLQDLMAQAPHQSLLWWEEELRRGLYGSPRGDIGMINRFAINRKPKRSGGKNPLP